MTAKNLTDRTVNALRKQLPKKGRPAYDVLDKGERGFGVRVSPKGALTYFLNARYPGSATTARRAIGRHGEMTLADARQTARDWKILIGRGLDPQEEAEHERQRQSVRRADTFAKLAEDFIAALPAGERKRDEVTRDIRRELIPALGAKPITDIRTRDVVAVVLGVVARGAPHQARNVLGYARRVFKWWRVQDPEHRRDPCDAIDATALLGAKTRRKRTLVDDELRAVWRAAGSLDYPYGPLFRLLVLTGARKSEIAEARWSEVDRAQRALVIPPERHKSDEGHVIPLCDDALAIIDALPRFKGGDYLFSTTAGEKPVNGFSKTKERLDRRTLRTWRALGRRAGSNRRKATVAPWVIHDIRRTVRTRLSALVPQDIAERIIGHAQSDLVRTYDLWSYVEERREGLRLWQDRLRAILAPSSGPTVDGGNVIPWAKRTAAVA